MRSLLYFGATWCGPCQRFSPIVDNVVGDCNVDITKVDVDDNRELANEHGIMSVPSLLLLDGKSVLKRHEGTMGESALRRWLLS